MEEKSLNEKLDDILEKLNEKENKKKFKLPWTIRSQEGKTGKKNIILVLFIRSNGSTIFKLVPIVDDTIKIGEYFYEASANYILKYNKFPLLIIKEWDMQPLKLKDEVKESIDGGRMTAGEKYILTRMKLEMIKPKMQFNIWVIIIAIVVVVGGLWALNNFGLIKL